MIARTLFSFAGFALVSSALLGGGCAKIERSSPQAVNTQEDPFDPALQTRQWDETVSYYANGDTIHQPAGFNYSPDTARPNWQYYVLDTGIFALNVVTLPYTLVTNVPWVQNEVSQGVVLEPSHTAMPPLPASPVGVEEVSTTKPTTERTQ